MLLLKLHLQIAPAVTDPDPGTDLIPENQALPRAQHTAQPEPAALYGRGWLQVEALYSKGSAAAQKAASAPYLGRLRARLDGSLGSPSWWEKELHMTCVPVNAHLAIKLLHCCWLLFLQRRAQSSCFLPSCKSPLFRTSSRLHRCCKPAVAFCWPNSPSWNAQNHRTTEYPGLQGTHKAHGAQPLGPHTSPFKPKPYG